MKKTLLTFLLSACTLCLQGQDTLVPRDTNLFYNWWYEDYVAADSDVFLRTDPLWDIDLYWGQATLIEVAIRFETDTPIDILGISFPVRSTYETFGQIPPFAPVYINLYAAEDTGIRLVGQFDRFNDPVSPLYYKPYDFFGYFNTYMGGMNPGSGDCVWRHELDSFPCKEYYFETPVRVKDSFYISFNGPRSGGVEVTSAQVMRSINPYGVGGETICDSLLPNTFPYFKYKYRVVTNPAYGVYDTLPWENTEARIMMLAFPIIRYGSPYANCIPVNGITYKEESSGQFLFTWNDTIPSHRGWEFTYVPDGTSPDAGTTLACDSATASAVVEVNRHYRAYVRPRCVGNRYGDWGDGIPFWHGSTPPDPTGINPVEGSEALFTLTPNPAKNHVTVTIGEAAHSSALSGTSPDLGKELITVRDAAGHEVLKQAVPAGQTTVVLDLQEQPAGAYFVTLTAAGHSATQRLVLQ